MGLFGFRKRSQLVPAQPPALIELRIPKVNDPPITPETLRKQLFDAVALGDEDKLCRLCQVHEKSIFEQGMIWSKVPPEITASPALMRWYGSGLKVIARFCAERLGKPELMDRVPEFEALPGRDPAQQPPDSNG
jgi:hypothetical protein